MNPNASYRAGLIYNAVITLGADLSRGAGLILSGGLTLGAGSTLGACLSHGAGLAPCVGQFRRNDLSRSGGGRRREIFRIHIIARRLPEKGQQGK